MPRTGHPTKQLILEAAAEELAKVGLAQLTLEAVARRAGVSKGALFHHYASRTLLISAVVEHLDMAFDDTVRRICDEDPHQHGRSVRAYVEAIDAQHQDPIRSQWAAVGSSFLWEDAALDSLRRLARRYMAADRAEAIDPIVALVARLAADGLWLSDRYDIYPMTAGQRQSVKRFLMSMTNQCDEAATQLR